MSTYPYDPKNYLTSSLKSGAREVVELLWRLRASWPSLWIGSGWRPGSVEHASGYAVDLMIAEKVGGAATGDRLRDGNALRDFLIKHRKALGLRGLIFNGYIYGYSDSTWGARPLTWKPSDNSNQHRDHIHMYGLTSMGVPASFKPGSVPEQQQDDPEPEVDPWDGKSLPDLDVFSDGFEHQANLLLQKRLKAHGYSPGEVDGYFGPKTRAAVTAFQKAQGWTRDDADGIPGPTTWARLMADPKVTTAASVTTVSVAHLKRARYADPPKSDTPKGSCAAEVLILERALDKINRLASKRVDGHYGSDTVSAVKDFQRDYSSDSTPDGWMGPLELKRLLGLAKMTHIRVIN